MKATVNTQQCKGCGICQVICPEVFRMNGGGRKEFALVRHENVPEDVENFCLDARDCCQAKAIQIAETAPYADTASPQGIRRSLSGCP